MDEVVWNLPCSLQQHKTMESHNPKKKVDQTYENVRFVETWGTMLRTSAVEKQGA